MNVQTDKVIFIKAYFPLVMRQIRAKQGISREILSFSSHSYYYPGMYKDANNLLSFPTLPFSILPSLSLLLSLPFFPFPSFLPSSLPFPSSSPLDFIPPPR